jgi:membrane fusion protein, multidrug efflux system
MKSILAITVLAVIGCNNARGQDGAPAPAASGAAGPVPTIEVTKVVAKPLDTATHLEGELTPYETVAIHARVNGFLSKVLVDRGSRVKKGQLLLTLVAPELNAQRAEAQAKLEGDKGTFERLNAASKTPGAVAGHEVEIAQATMEADQARLDSLHALEQYLTVTAPFDGTITERNVHPGALVGPQTSAASTPLLRIEEVQTLRLTVAVPEALAGAIAEGATADFSVKAFPGVKFTGVTKRVAHSLDMRTRSMPVELDVDNTDGRLAPGMFADVLWPVKRSVPSLFVPPGSVVQSTERTFVARIRDGVVEQVPVQRGSSQGDLIEVFGGIKEGDVIARRGSDELRQGLHVETRAPKPAGSAP